MGLRSLFALFCLSQLSPQLAPKLAAQGTKPKPACADYPVHLTMPDGDLCAEYLAHSLPTSRGVLATPDYVVIEVAVYPGSKTGLSLSAEQFRLVLNGGSPLTPQTPGMVAASLKYPDWERRPRVEAEAGTDSGSIILGRPQPTSRFPGDPTDKSKRLPLPPGSTDPEQPAETKPEPPMTIDEACRRLALPEGKMSGPVSGYVFFLSRAKKVKSAELLRTLPDGAEFRLKLF